MYGENNPVVTEAVTSPPARRRPTLADHFRIANTDPDAFFSHAAIAELERIPTYNLSEQEKMTLAYNEARRQGASFEDLDALYGFAPGHHRSYYTAQGVAPLEFMEVRPTAYSHPELFGGQEAVDARWRGQRYQHGDVRQNYDGSVTVFRNVPGGSGAGGTTYNPDGSLREGGPRATLQQMLQVRDEPHRANSRGPGWAGNPAGLIAGAQRLDDFNPANYQEMRSQLEALDIPFGRHFSQFLPANGGASRPSATDSLNLAFSRYDGPFAPSNYLQPADWAPSKSGDGGTTLTEDFPSDGLNTTQGTVAGTTTGGIERGEWSALAGRSNQPVPGAGVQGYSSSGEDVDIQAAARDATLRRREREQARAYYAENVLPKVLEDPTLAAMHEAGVDWTDPATRGKQVGKIQAVIDQKPEVAATLNQQLDGLQQMTGANMQVGDTDLKKRIVPFLISYGVTDLQDLKVLDDGTIYNTKTGLDVPAEFGYDPTVTGGVRATYKLRPVTLADGTKAVLPDVAMQGKKTGIQQAMPVAMAALAVFGGPITSWLGQTLAPGLGAAAGAGTASAAQTALGNSVLSTGVAAASGQRGSDLLRTAVTAPVAGYIGSTAAGFLAKASPGLANMAGSVASNGVQDLAYGRNPIDRYASPMGVASLLFNGFKKSGEV